MNGKQYLISLGKRNSIIALIAGLIVLFCTLMAVFWAISYYDAGMLKYFTLLSNLLAAIGAAFMIPFAVEGIRKKRFSLPRWVVLFQFSGTVCVIITMITSLALILPTQGIEQALARYNFWLHIVSPLATAVLFQTIESNVIVTKKETLFCMIPYFVYMLAYFINVIVLKIWRDIYGTTLYVPFIVSLTGMILVGFGIACGLRLIQNYRVKQKQKELSKLWSDDLSPVEIKIEAFGLGRFMGQRSDNEIEVPIDIFRLLSEKYNIPLEDLTKAFIKGATDSINKI